MVDARHLGDLLDAAGLTWRGYADGAAGPCDLTGHNDRAGGYYQIGRASCRERV